MPMLLCAMLLATNRSVPRPDENALGACRPSGLGVRGTLAAENEVCRAALVRPGEGRFPGPARDRPAADGVRRHRRLLATLGKTRRAC
jgi:hypothetical protein